MERKAKSDFCSLCLYSKKRNSFERVNNIVKKRSSTHAICVNCEGVSHDTWPRFRKTEALWAGLLRFHIWAPDCQGLLGAPQGTSELLGAPRGSSGLLRAGGREAPRLNCSEFRPMLNMWYCQETLVKHSAPRPLEMKHFLLVVCKPMIVVIMLNSCMSVLFVKQKEQFED